MKRRIRAADETEEPPLPSEVMRDDAEHLYRPPARLVYTTQTPPPEKEEK